MKTTPILLLTAALPAALAAGCHGGNGGQPASEHQAAGQVRDDDEDREVDESEEGEREGGDRTTPVTGGAPAPGAQGAEVAMRFDGDKDGAAPAGFTFGRTGQGAPGKWVVKTEDGAPSGKNVLAQVDADKTDYRFPVAIADAPSLADARVQVSCRPVSGKVDQACGIVFRAADADNYYLTRANALENNVRLYHVVQGKRVQFAGWSGTVKKGVWHQLRVDAKGNQFSVYFDGTRVIEANDKTFQDPGKVGLWTKADSVTYFDDLTVTPL